MRGIRVTFFGALLACCLAQAVPVGASPASFDQAVRAMRKGDFEQARAGFLSAVAETSDTRKQADAQGFAIKCLFSMQRYPEFFGEVAALRASQPAHPALDDLWYLEGRALEQQGLFDKARAKFLGLKNACDKASSESTAKLATPSPYANSAYYRELPARIAECDALSFTAKDSETTPDLAERRAQWLLRVYDAKCFDVFSTWSRDFLTSYPAYASRDEIMFRQMLLLRRSRKYQDARELANRIASETTGSRRARQMGGLDGRTEDRAAFDFAAVRASYARRKFGDCTSQAAAFLARYPNNWRVPELLKIHLYAAYHQGDREHFKELSDKLAAAAETTKPLIEARILAAALLVKSGRHVEARKVLDGIEAEDPSRAGKGTLFDLRMDSYLYEHDYASLAAVAKTLKDSAGPGTREYACGRLWEGIAAVSKSNPDTTVAETAFDEAGDSGVLSGEEVATALHWSAEMARRRGDFDKVRTMLERIRDESPPSPTRQRALLRLSAVLDSAASSALAADAVTTSSADVQ